MLFPESYLNLKGCVIVRLVKVNGDEGISTSENGWIPITFHKRFVEIKYPNPILSGVARREIIMSPSLSLSVEDDYSYVIYCKYSNIWISAAKWEKVFGSVVAECIYNTILYLHIQILLIYVFVVLDTILILMSAICCFFPPIYVHLYITYHFPFISPTFIPHSPTWNSK